MGPGNQDCIRFLQIWLPRLDLKWAGYRKVRRTVCKRIGRRMRALGLTELAPYGHLLEKSPEERARLDVFCRIPISRFYRDRAVFQALAERLLPDLAARAARDGAEALQCWCAGCASGEEVYSLRLLWDLASRRDSCSMRLEILGTDVDAFMLERATAGCYPLGSLKDLPADWQEKAFTRSEGAAQDKDIFCLRPAFRHGIHFGCEDIRKRQPDGPFHLVLCRNFVFTYFANDLQRETLSGIARRLLPGGLLVLGAHERLPATEGLFERVGNDLPVWRKPTVGQTGPA